MNREDTKKAIAVMQAYVDGEEIEWRDHVYSDAPWKPVKGEPLWAFEHNEYRVRSNPREFWVVPRKDATGFFLTEDEYQSGEWVGAIKVREITDE